MDAFALDVGAAASFGSIDAANDYIASTSPGRWRAIRRTRGSSDARSCSTSPKPCASPAVLLLPIMPTSAAEILRRVGETDTAGESSGSTDARWRTTGERIIAKRTRLMAAASRPLKE